MVEAQLPMMFCEVVGMKAKKNLGQNFLKDQNIIAKIAAEVTAFSNDLILEIGPGRGALTERLVSLNSYYLAYELDQDLKLELARFISPKRQIIFADFLKADLVNDLKKIPYENLYLVGNLPYYITTPILEKIISSQIKPKKIVIMVQKEVGWRFMADAHTKDYGYFTLYLRHYFNVTKVCDVGRDAFWPQPKVESMVLKLEPRENIANLDMEDYQTFLKRCFSQKRKTLKNNLGTTDFAKIQEILKQYNHDDNVRAEELSEEEFVSLFNHLNTK